MPQVTVYVRDEDLDKWKAIQRKSEFVSNAINGLSSNGRTEGFEPSYLGSSPSEPAKRVGYSNLFPSEVSSDVRPDIKIASEGKPSNMVLVKTDEGTVAERNQWASAGVDMTPACCLNKKPCKHWSWDGVNSQYVNSITGEIKPVEV